MVAQRSEASEGPADRRPRVLQFVSNEPAEAQSGVTVVVLDTTWAGPPAGSTMGGCIALRDVAERVMSGRDLFADAAALLDGWAESSGVIDMLTIEDTSFWYGERLRYWMWLVDQVLWLAIVEDLLDTERPTELQVATGADRGLVDAARALARQHGIAIRVEATEGDDVVREPAAALPAGIASPPSGPGGPAIVQRLVRRWRPPEPVRRRRELARHIDRLEQTGRGRLLVIQAHARQRVDTAAGPRRINTYLGPVAERLEGTRLEPLEIDLRASVDDDATWRRCGDGRDVTFLPVEALEVAGPRVSMARARESAGAVAEEVSGMDAPLVVSGEDLGPSLASLIGSKTRASLSRSIVDVARIRQFLGRVRPAGILLADEYHRQDWLAAAAAEGVPTAAIQHGVIYRWHTGYMHRTRPATLRLPDRTYVFGSWERDLLIDHSVYREDEVRIGGSPRLDLVERGRVDREAVRHELGVADGDRLVVLSGTWGHLYRRFHYPIALAHLFCRPIPRLHLVVKLHPSERDEGPYRAVIDGLAAAGGFVPPPVTVVQSIDLYRLLAAADAHLGIHSTVLTEAVAAGTPNLLVDVLAASDLLGYLEGGAAIPVRTADDLAAALDRPRDAAAAPGRDAFLHAHFEPGSASERIAADLLAWLA